MVTTYAAIPKTNPELVEARTRGIPVILRPAVLAKLMTGYTTLMVTGTAPSFQAPKSRQTVSGPLVR